MEKIYIVNIWEGEYEIKIFATFDKDKADKWANRFNSIVSNNYDRILGYYDDENFEKDECFWYNLIAYNRPSSFVEEIEYRT